MEKHGRFPFILPHPKQKGRKSSVQQCIADYANSQGAYLSLLKSGSISPAEYVYSRQKFEVQAGFKPGETAYFFR